MHRALIVGAVAALLLCSFVPADAATPSTTPTATPTATPSSTPAATPDTTPAATTSPTPTETPAAEAAAPASPTATPAATTEAAAPASPTATPAATTEAAAPASPKETPAATTEAAAPASPTATPAAAAAPKTEAAAPADEAAAPAATPKATPAATKKPKAPSPPPPAPPAPIVIDPTKLVAALPADQTASAPGSAPDSSSPSSASSQTAADLVLRVSGTGVTPFDIPQQTILLRAMASVLTTVSLADLQIRYVTSSVNLRRRLLAENDLHQMGRALLQNDSAQAAAAAKGELYNVAAVTLQANCSDSDAAANTLTEMQSVLSNNLLASAVQAYGASTWGLSLLSLTSVDPSVALNNQAKCKKNLGSFCLDKTSLSVAAAEVIMALGCLFIIVLVAIPCVWLEWRRKSGMMAELDPTPETPRTPLDKVQQFYNSLVSKAKAASPLHRRAGSNGRNAFKSDSPMAGRSTVQMTATS